MRLVRNLLGQEVVRNIEDCREGVDARIHRRLDRTLALVEREAERLNLVRVRRAGNLRLELRAERALGLGDKISTDVGPGRGVRRLDRHLGAGEVADLDLRRHLRLHERQDAAVHLRGNCVHRNARECQKLVCLR